jgi:hypothetical protein
MRPRSNKEVSRVEVSQKEVLEDKKRRLVNRAVRSKLIPDVMVLARYGISNMTLWRWDRDETLGFPQPTWIRNRKYRDADELDAFDARQRQSAGPTNKPPRGLGRPRKPALNP